MKKRQKEKATRYFVEYLDWEKGRAKMVEGCKKNGEDPDYATLWDYVDQSEITVEHACPTKSAAFEWAKENAPLDVFNMPRVTEQTLTLRTTDDRGRIVEPWLEWQRTGYWEADGEEIEEAAE